MNTTVDLLQIKIEKAKAELPEDSRRAIDAVDWKSTILGMRTEKGYSYEQLEDLETETELLLCGLINPEEYPKELEKRLGMPKNKIDELVNDMNEKVFKRIREELVKIIENRKPKDESKIEAPVKDREIIENRENLLNKIENPTPIQTMNKETPSILSQKLGGSFQATTKETDHSLGNMTKSTEDAKTKLPKVDPYRMPIE